MIGRILDWNTSCASGSCMVGCLVAIAVLALVIGFFVYRRCAGEGAPSAEPAKRVDGKGAGEESGQVPQRPACRPKQAL